MKWLTLSLVVFVGCRPAPRAAADGDGSTSSQRPVASSNPELDALYAVDQADREGLLVDAGPTLSSLTQRDDERMHRLREILDAGGARVSEDFEHAAMLFQHGHDVEDYRMAHELALKAVLLDPSNRHAKWLAAASKDRELMTLGNPQLYGTQFRSVEGGPWVLYPVDPSVTDDDRAKWNVPPLAEAERRAAQMNSDREAQHDR